MTLQKWVKDRAIHGLPTFSIEDVRKAGMYSSEQILQNELTRLCNNKMITNVYRGFYVIFPVQYVLRESIPATYYIDQLMGYLEKPYYVSLLSAAELLGAAHQRPQQFSVMTTFPKRRVTSTRNVPIEWLYRNSLPEECIFTRNTETGIIRIANPLLTAADLVQYQQYVGGLSRVATVLEELAEQIDIERDFPLLVRYVKTVVWQRLGYIMDKVLGEEELADLIYNKVKELPGRIGYALLSTTSETSATSRDKRWKLNINVEIETDEI